MSRGVFFVFLTLFGILFYMAQKHQTAGWLARYFAKNIVIVISLVLIWRGIWYILDRIDMQFFAGDHRLSAIGGILVGLLLLYIPDKDLKEIEKL